MTVKVKGLAELQKMLESLPAKLEANVMRGALRAGMKVVLEDVKNNVPVASGELKSGLKIGTKSRRGVITATVKATGKHAYLAPWMEFGTKPHLIEGRDGGNLYIGGVYVKSVEHPGVKPRPFMRPALDNQATNATVAVGNYIAQRLKKKHGLDTSHIMIEGDE